LDVEGSPAIEERGGGAREGMMGGGVKRNDFRLPDVDGESFPCGIGVEMCKHQVKGLRGGGKEDQIVCVEKVRDEASSLQ
jgi:hypothetical protein